MILLLKEQKAQRDDINELTRTVSLLTGRIDGLDKRMSDQQNYIYLVLVILGIVNSVISIFGDLSFSVIKRKYNIKDFGSILPGHGGVLDRFDSMLYTAPVFYYFVILSGIA